METMKEGTPKYVLPGSENQTITLQDVVNPGVATALYNDFAKIGEGYTSIIPLNGNRASVPLLTLCAPHSHFLVLELPEKFSWQQKSKQKKKLLLKKWPLQLITSNFF